MMSEESAAAAAPAQPSQQAATAEGASAGPAAPAVEQVDLSVPAEPTQPSSDLLEILEELCRERELNFEAIDASIRTRLAEVPKSLRFRPGSGEGRLLLLTLIMLSCLSAADQLSSPAAMKRNACPSAELLPFPQAQVVWPWTSASGAKSAGSPWSNWRH
jgi:hypothetical protein